MRERASECKGASRVTLQGKDGASRGKRGQSIEADGARQDSRRWRADGSVLKATGVDLDYLNAAERTRKICGSFDR